MWKHINRIYSWERKDGRGGEIRTHDPLVPNQMRYQTALHPDVKNVLLKNGRGVGI